MLAWTAPTTARRMLGLLACSMLVLAAVIAVSMAIAAVRGHGGATAADKLLASLPTGRYTAAGPYVGPDISNLHAPQVILGPDRVPVVAYPGRGYQANPVSVAQYGLTAYSRFIATGDARDWDEALRSAHWLIASQRPDGAWLYRFPFHIPGATLSAPWRSAMAQGQAMSLLERVYRRTHQRRYLTAAVRALGPLRKPVSDAGVRRCYRGDCALPFFEEYATPQPSEVLNGFMFTLVGLYDLSTVAPRSGAQALYLAGRRTLSAALPAYDRHGLASYDLASAQVASQGYQAVHVYLLRALSSVNPSREYRYYAARWQHNLASAPS